INLETAVAQTEALRAVPLPEAVLRPIVTGIGRILLDTTLETISATLDSDDGTQAVQATASAVLDQLFEGPGLEELESLTREISLHVIEHMKETVKIKKWALPEDQRGVPSSLSEIADEIAAVEFQTESTEEPEEKH
ncbi:MAG: hypothetical protein GY906_00205, partial [bacterium]|nr:hypothetical protein [bacterium]